LVDGANGLEKWSESYDRPAGDELAIQTGIAESVAGALRIRFGGAERAALQLGGTNVPAAQDALLRARAILGGDEDSYRRWLAEIDAALAADPKFATAHAARAMGVAGHASQSLGSGAKRAEAMASAQASADQAIRLAPLFPYAHSAFGYVREVQLDMAGAYRAYRHALTLPGSDARTLNNISGFLGAMGRTDEALQINARGIALDPLEPRGKQTKAGILLDAERYAEGLALLRQLPADRVPHVWIGNSLVLMGRPKEAIGEFEQVSTEWMRLQGLAIARARTGDRAAADKALAAFRAIDDGSLDYQFVQLHAQRGEIELAIAALERAWVKRDPGLAAMKGDPLLKPLRGDPRFQAVQAKLNFP
jgi:tetratricopeptide (TPR) repeat protein